MANARGTTAQRTALVVHPDMTALSALQGEFLKHAIATIVARDLPTALLAMTQHYFDIAVVADTVSEAGDGWALGGVLRMVFPKAFLATITPSSDVDTLKNAINNGIDEISKPTPTSATWWAPPCAAIPPHRGSEAQECNKILRVFVPSW